MPNLRLVTCSPDTGASAEHELALDEPGSACALRVRAVAGASAIHVTLRDGERVHLRAEVECEGGESVPLRIEHDAEGDLHVTSPGRRIFTLPVKRTGEPLPLRVAPAGARLDLAIVVDGTTRMFVDGKPPRLDPLLANEAAWKKHVQQIVAFVEALAAAHPALRVAVMAFGDEALARVQAADLTPKYRLIPPAAERALRPQPVAQLTAALIALRPTSGGDYVDALAEALHACTKLRWEDGRKLVLLTGDSPGHSLLFPAPRQADAGLRRRDVDVEVMKLFQLGVETMTIYHDLPPQSGYYDNVESRALLEFARRQYQRLASRPEVAFLAPQFDPKAAAAAVSGGPAVMARGACVGVVDQG